MNSLESEQFIVAPRVAPIVWFVAATCVKLVVKQIPKATVKFSSHAVIQANARQLSSKQVADAIVNGKNSWINIHVLELFMIKIKILM